MGVQVDGQVGGLFQNRHQFLRRVRSQQAGHILDADGIRAHVLNSLGNVFPIVQGVSVAQGVAKRYLRVSLFLVAGLHRRLQVAQVVEAVENTDDIDAVGNGLLYEVFHHVIGVMVVSQNILAAEQHLQLRILESVS